MAKADGSLRFNLVVRKSNIVEGEELTCYYGEAHHEGKRRCTCNSKDCRGFL